MKTPHSAIRVAFVALAALLTCAFPRMGGGLIGPAAPRLTAVYLNAAAAGNIASANSFSTLNAITDGYFYPTGGLAANTTIGTMTTTASSGSPVVSYSIAGDTNNCYKMSGANLQVNSSTGACAAGSAAETITITPTATGYGGSPTITVSSYLTQTYYLNTAGGGGNDSNNGRSSGAPWLSTNHAVHCGDTLLMAASTSYDPNNYGLTGVTGTVTCPGNDNLAFVKCVSTLSACKISGGYNGIWATSNYWGYIGVDVEGQTNSCVRFTPPYPPGTGAVVHHFGLINSIVAGCAGSGLQTGQAAGSGNGGDYEVILGVMAYGNSTAAGPCFSGISFAGDSDADAAAVTHRYLSQIFAWHNINGANCNGSNTTDGNGFIMDRPDVNDVTGTLVAEKNMFIGNGGRGFHIFPLNSSPGGVFNVLYRNSTTAGNFSDPNLTGNPNMQINIGNTSQTYLSAVVTTIMSAAYAVSSGQTPAPEYALVDSYLISATSAIDGSWLYGTGSPQQNIENFHTGYTCPKGGGPITVSGSNTNSCPGMTISTDPVFAGAAYCTGSQTTTTLTLTSCTGHAVANGMQPFSTAGTQVTSGALLSGCTGSGTITCTSSASQTITSTSMVLLPIPGAPSCSGQSDVIACATAMGIISNFTPTASNATNFGYGASLACDANNTSAYINNVSRMAPAALNPCG